MSVQKPETDLSDRDPEEEVSTGVCAAHHGLSRQTLTLAIGRGDLEAHRTGRNYRVKVRDCLAYLPGRVQQESGKKGARVRQGIEPKKPPKEAGPDRRRVSGEPLKSLTVGIPESLYERIKARCEERGEPMAGEVREALEKHFGEG